MAAIRLIIRINQNALAMKTFSKQKNIVVVPLGQCAALVSEPFVSLTFSLAKLKAHWHLTPKSEMPVHNFKNKNEKLCGFRCLIISANFLYLNLN